MLEKSLEQLVDGALGAAEVLNSGRRIGQGHNSSTARITRGDQFVVEVDVGPARRHTAYALKVDSTIR